MKKRVIIIIFFVLIIAVCFFGYCYLISPVDSNNKETVVFEIKDGESSIEIADSLKKEKLIKSKYFFLLLYKLENSKIKFTTYELNRSMNVYEILDTISTGNGINTNLVNITLKEGDTIKNFSKEISDKTGNSYTEVIAVFNDKTFIKKMIDKYWFLDDSLLSNNLYYPLEGYIVPDTYEINSKSSIEDIIIKLLNESDKKFASYKNIENFKDIVILSSIVEKEAITIEDKKEVAGVFYNRIASNMNLGSDVTVYYGLQLDMSNDLTSEQINSVNAYNTRLPEMRGKLPIGAVCNPSVETINATIDYSKNDYLYFVADKNGKVYYSKTLNEHNNTISKIKREGLWIW